MQTPNLIRLIMNREMTSLESDTQVRQDYGWKGAVTCRGLESII